MGNPRYADKVYEPNRPRGNSAELRKFRKEQEAADYKPYRRRPVSVGLHKFLKQQREESK